MTADDATAEERPARLRVTKSLTLLACVVLTFGVTWALLAGQAEEQTLQLAISALLVVTALVWCQADALEREVPLRGWERVGLVLLLGIFLPLRLFRTRGWRALLSLLLVALYVAVVLLAALVGGLAAGVP